VIERGERLPAVLLLYDGQLSIEGKSKGKVEFAQGDFIGLANILSKKPYAQTIRVVSAHAKFLSISGEEITHLVESDHKISSTMLRLLAEAA
jgi:CRP-like cAMP-binding protein